MSGKIELQLIAFQLGVHTYLVSSLQRVGIYPIIPVGYIIKANMTISEFVLDISRGHTFFGIFDPPPSSFMDSFTK